MVDAPARLLTAAPYFRRLLLLGLSAALAGPAQALLEFNDGHDRVSVEAGYGITYDSNLFAHADSAGDYSQSLSVESAYTRRAGLIGVDASAGVTVGRFHRFTDQDYTNPTAKLAFNKSQGRLTGSFNLAAARESRSDVAANLRADSWYYTGDLNLRYPINARYYFTSESAFSVRDFVNQRSLFNLSSFSQAVNGYYVYSSKLDLLGGYRIRWGDAVGGSRTQDHAVNFGATGTLTSKLSGTISLGYQWRHESGGQRAHYDGLTSSLSLAWPMSRKVTFSSALSKDFMTTATDVSVDATAASLSAALKPSARLNLTAGVAYVVTRYLGTGGDGRVDRAPAFNLSASVSLTSAISASISYAYTDNQSNVAYSEFSRQAATFNLSVRF